MAWFLRQPHFVVWWTTVTCYSIWLCLVNPRRGRSPGLDQEVTEALQNAQGGDSEDNGRQDVGENPGTQQGHVGTHAPASFQKLKKTLEKHGLTILACGTGGLLACKVGSMFLSQESKDQLTTFCKELKAASIDAGKKESLQKVTSSVVGAINFITVAVRKYFGV